MDKVELGCFVMMAFIGLLPILFMYLHAEEESDPEASRDLPAARR
jgi:hypothetical protein